MSSDRALIIFVRNPVPGTGKTRLAASVGVEKAHEVYLHLLAHTRSIAGQFDGQRHLFYVDNVSMNDAWDNELFSKDVQHDGDLGTKMRQAFQKVLTNSPRAVIIGSDCPSLSIDHINQAFKALENKDVVIGPSKDGGYYLLGMKHVQTCLFDDKSWSTEALMQETISSMETHGLSYTLLDTLNDIDTIEDLRQSNLAHLI